jgi:hypothetical protein
LKSGFSRLTEGAFRFVFLHVPLEDPRWKGVSNTPCPIPPTPEKLLEIFERGNVTFSSPPTYTLIMQGRWGRDSLHRHRRRRSSLYGKESRCVLLPTTCDVDVDTTVSGAG